MPDHALSVTASASHVYCVAVNLEPTDRSNKTKGNRPHLQGDAVLAVKRKFKKGKKGSKSQIGPNDTAAPEEGQEAGEGEGAGTCVCLRLCMCLCRCLKYVHMQICA